MNYKFLLVFFSVFIFDTPIFSQTVQINSLEKNVLQYLNIPDMSITPIHGGLTNTSFLATNLTTTEKYQFVIRVGKKDCAIFGIDRFCEASSQESASQIGIAPKILFSNPQDGTLVSLFINGNTLTPENLCNFFQLERVVQIIKKCHSIPFKKEFVNNTIYEKIRKMISASLLYENPFISQNQATQIRSYINQIENHFYEKEKKYEGLCHCDLFPGNFIDNGKQLWLIDWEYSCWGNILFDLASLCTEFNLNENQIKDILKLYFGQTWEENYFDFKLMNAIFNLRNAFWYDLRGKELTQIGQFNMQDYAQKHLFLFGQDIEKLLLSLSMNNS